LQWSGSQAVGAACVDEWNRVNPAVLAPANGLLSRADAIVTRIARTLGASPSVTACVANRIPGAAARALDAKVKALLQDTAVREQRLWMQAEPAVDPTAGACMPHCGLCSSGWVGTITCTKAVTGPYNYHHQETQTWSVGGNSTQAGGQTIYPTEWTAVGSGGKSMQTWVVHATGAGQLAVFSNSTGITFSRVNSQISVFNGIQATPPPSYTEFEYQFQPFTGPTGSTQVTGSNTRTTAGCETPVTPGSSTCTVACTWKMTLQ
jgi:hypothetical protein